MMAAVRLAPLEGLGLEDLVARLVRVAELRADGERAGLECVECGARSSGDARGWRTYLTVDDELASYCPACGEREFNDG